MKQLLTLANFNLMPYGLSAEDAHYVGHLAGSAGARDNGAVLVVREAKPDAAGAGACRARPTRPEGRHEQRSTDRRASDGNKVLGRTTYWAAAASRAGASR